LSYLASKVEVGGAGPVLKTASPHHGTALASGVIGSLIGTAIGALLLICFVIGLSARVVRWFRRTISDDAPTRHGQRRNVGRDWADDVPLLRRRRPKKEPTHPSFNGRR
jgi:hypothetical protein